MLTGNPLYIPIRHLSCFPSNHFTVSYSTKTLDLLAPSHSQLKTDSLPPLIEKTEPSDGNSPDFFTQANLLLPLPDVLREVITSAWGYSPTSSSLIFTLPF